jgi:SAM-dependent methyltransferase
VKLNTDMVRYYARRAIDYEAVYTKEERRNDLACLRTFLQNHFEDEDILEIACGPGYWTNAIAGLARSVVATDINDSMLDVARRRQYGRDTVEIRKADAFELPDFGRQFSAGFAAFWWSHVPKTRLIQFLSEFHSHLRLGAKVVFFDDRYLKGKNPPIARTDAKGNTFQIRKLQDGTEHEVLKNFPLPGDLMRIIQELGCEATVLQLEYYWLLSYKIR